MSDITWTNCKVRLGDLRKWEGNPAEISKAAAGRLVESFNEFGQAHVILIEPDYQILDGHQRDDVWGAKFGDDFMVDCRMASRKFTDEERRKFVIYLRSGTTGSYDWDTLSGWDAKELIEWGLDDTTLRDWKRDVTALDNLLESEKQEPVDAEPQIDRADELNEKWQVKTGDLWQIGEHRLLCGDSTVKEDVDRVMGGEKARLEFSDPPYDFETKGGGIRENATHMDEIEKAGINKFDPSVLELIADTSVFCCNKPLLLAYFSLAEREGQAWDLCFYKKENTPPNFGGHLMTDTEYLPVIGKQSPNSGMEKSVYSKAYIGGLDENHLAAWQKPIALVEKFILLYSKVGDVVIDRFLCTGTTMVACENLHRKCRAIEISPNYCAVILQRMEEAFGIIGERID